MGLGGDAEGPDREALAAVGVDAAVGGLRRARGSSRPSAPPPSRAERRLPGRRAEGDVDQGSVSLGPAYEGVARPVASTSSSPDRPAAESAEVAHRGRDDPQHVARRATSKRGPALVDADVVRPESGRRRAWGRVRRGRDVDPVRSRTTAGTTAGGQASAWPALASTQTARPRWGTTRSGASARASPRCDPGPGDPPRARRASPGRSPRCRCPPARAEDLAHPGQVGRGRRHRASRRRTRAGRRRREMARPGRATGGVPTSDGFAASWPTATARSSASSGSVQTPRRPRGPTTRASADRPRWCRPAPRRSAPGGRSRCCSSSRPRRAGARSRRRPAGRRSARRRRRPARCR